MRSEADMDVIIVSLCFSLQAICARRRVSFYSIDNVNYSKRSFALLRMTNELYRLLYPTD